MSAARLSRRDFLRGRAPSALGGLLAAYTEPATESAGDLPLVARVDAGACLGSASQVCTSCLERCGVRAAVRLRGLLPVIDEAHCTGCGECAQVCPAPRPAIRMVTRTQPIKGEK
jgi:Na+-translocating ferredoxin:NAD+ oxidoreductase RNF subunit RnfB